jgi:hypothetical protein
MYFKGPFIFADNFEIHPFLIKGASAQHNGLNRNITSEYSVSFSNSVL